MLGKLTLQEIEDLYENAPCGRLSILPDGKIANPNSRLSAWTGFSADKLDQMKFSDLLTLAARIFYETHALPVLRIQGHFDEISLELNTAAGARLPVIACATQKTDGEGHPQSVWLAMFRSAERRRYEHELVRAKDTANTEKTATEGLLAAERKTSELREQFIAILGHDLRNPLASIQGGARLLVRSTQSDVDKAILSMIEGSVMRMAALIDNVLDFARGRLGGGISLDRREVLLKPILLQVVDELRVGAPGREISTDFVLDHPVYCDAVRLSQLVSNLVGNAITHGVSEEAIRLNAITTEDELVLWVSNGGAPIPPAAMERLFQPFFRGEVRASQQGLGLGLHIASEIASAHSGTLLVDSSDLETRFTFRMPLSVKEESTPA